MDFVYTHNDLGYKLADQVTKINDTCMCDMYEHFKLMCINHTGACSKFTFSHVNNVGPRLIDGNNYKRSPCDLNLDDFLRAQVDNSRIEKLCDGFGYGVYFWLKRYPTNPKLTKLLVAKESKSRPSDCEVSNFRKFLVDCANYVGFYFTQVTNESFCDDVFEHFNKLYPDCPLNEDAHHVLYNRFAYDLIMCAAMLYARANSVKPCEYDGPDLVDTHKSFRINGVDPQYPKGLYSTDIAMKIFEVLR